MPIYDYQCRKCNAQFEQLVLPSEQTPPECPRCRSQDLEMMISNFAVRSGSTRHRAEQAKRARHQVKYKEHSHDVEKTRERIIKDRD